jgi:hypothetical protein
MRAHWPRLMRVAKIVQYKKHTDCAGQFLGTNETEQVYILVRTVFQQLICAWVRPSSHYQKITCFSDSEKYSFHMLWCYLKRPAVRQEQ